MKRYFPQKEKEVIGTKYDSAFEKDMHETVLADTSYHSQDHEVFYKIPKTYKPDFVYSVDGKTYLIETKGRFMDSDEARKYVFVRDFLPDDTELVFVFQKASTPMPHAAKRKDGTKRTHADWATDNKFKWFDSKSFNLSLLPS